MALRLGGHLLLLALHLSLYWKTKVRCSSCPSFLVVERRQSSLDWNYVQYEMKKGDELEEDILKANYLIKDFCDERINYRK
jgi:hypothetical protein